MNNEKLKRTIFFLILLFGDCSASLQARPIQSEWADLILGGSPAIVRYYINRGGEIEENVFNGQTPVLFAANADRWDIVSVLVERGANLEVVDRMGVTLGESAATSNVKLRSERGAYLQEVRSILKMKGLMESRDYYEEVRRERGARKMKELRELRERQQQ